MTKESLYKIAKMQNEEKVVLVKCGNFYKAFENDAILLWGLFGYLVKDGKVAFPLSVFASVISKLTRLGMSVVVAKSEDDISYYTSTGENTYKDYKTNAINNYETDGKLNEIKNLVDEKIKTSFVNYDKLLEFLNTLWLKHT